MNDKKLIPMFITVDTILNSCGSKTLKNLISSAYPAEAEISSFDCLSFISVKNMQESQDLLYFL